MKDVPSLCRRDLIWVLHKVEEGTPVDVALKEGDEGSPFLRGESQAIYVADQGHPIPVHDGDPQTQLVVPRSIRTLMRSGLAGNPWVRPFWACHSSTSTHPSIDCVAGVTYVDAAPSGTL